MVTSTDWRFRFSQILKNSGDIPLELLHLSFKMQESPVFLFYFLKPIKLHLLICFKELIISKHTEIQTKVSIKRFITECKKITDARMLSTITQKEVNIKGRITNEAKKCLPELKLSH